MENQEESLLSHQVRQRDTDALARFIEENRVQLTGFIRSITGARLLGVTEVDDLLQEVSATAIQSLPTAPLDDYAPMQWLQQIARRRVVDAHRFHFDAKRREAGKQQSIHAPQGAAPDALSLEQLLAASMTSPSAMMSQDNRISRMQMAIRELSDEQQKAIRMRFVDGLATKQIAESLGKSDVSVRVLLSRSMRDLEKLLQDVKPTR